jgi:hypothetical protein
MHTFESTYIVYESASNITWHPLAKVLGKVGIVYFVLEQERAIFSNVKLAATTTRNENNE